MFRKLSIQSKLTLMLIAVSVSSSLVIAFIGYRSGKQALTNRIYDQLNSLQFSTSQSVESYFDDVKLQLLLLAQNPNTIQATKELNSAYQKLESRSPNASYNSAITKYYQQEFFPKLAQNITGTPIAKTFQPKSSANQYLQYHYTIKSTDFDVTAAINNPGDGSEYSAKHAQFHPAFKEYITRYKHEDLFLIDPNTGNVIYTVYKGIDFGANLKTGFLQNSILAQAFEAVIKEPTLGFYVFQDYEPYIPSHNDPAAILATPIFDDGILIGILAMQLSSKLIDQIMTYDQQWEKVGLGKSGETYLVGSDLKLRSNSRFFLQNQSEYLKNLAAIGVDDETLNKIKRSETSILTQEVSTSATQKAAQGLKGTEIIRDYRNISVLSSYAPINILGKKWSVLAEIDEEEAFQPIRQFQKRVFISTSILVLLITLLALLISHYLVRPLKFLQEGFRKLGDGKLDTQINFKSQDEYQELALAFNDMVSNLKEKSRLLNLKSAENENLLLSILPSPVAQRLKQGEEQIADSFPNVTVLFADIMGFATLCESLSAEESVKILNELVSSFDDSIERYGVEKIKTIGSGYMAVGGLSIPRIDHTKRIVDFGLNMIRIIQVYNRAHHTDLKLQIGIHSGPVVAGIVGKSNFIYDLWGDTVGLAHWMKANGQENSIHVSREVQEQLKDFYSFEPQTIQDGNDTKLSWLLTAQ